MRSFVKRDIVGCLRLRLLFLVWKFCGKHTVFVCFFLHQFCRRIDSRLLFLKEKLGTPIGNLLFSSLLSFSELCVWTLANILHESLLCHVVSCQSYQCRFACDLIIIDWNVHAIVKEPFVRHSWLQWVSGTGQPKSPQETIVRPSNKSQSRSRSRQPLKRLNKQNNNKKKWAKKKQAARHKIRKIKHFTWIPNTLNRSIPREREVLFIIYWPLSFGGVDNSCNGRSMIVPFECWIDLEIAALFPLHFFFSSNPGAILSFNGVEASPLRHWNVTRMCADISVMLQ